MKSKIKKRLIAFMLCMVLVLSSAISAFADDLDTQAQDQTTTMADEPVATSMDDSTDEQQPVAEAEENQEQAVETQEEQQTEENVSEEPTTEDSSAVAEQEAIEKESDVSIQTTVNGTTITMSGPHSSFPEGNNYEISASELNEEETKDVEIALKKKEDETNTKIATYKAYDIKLLVDGIETQPTGDVNVKFEGGEVKENLTNAENVEVYHVDESNQTANDISGITAEDTVTMTTNHFSTYVITTTKDGGVDITVQHYLQNTTTPLYRDSTVHLNKGQEIKDLSSPSNYTAQKVVKVNRDGSADTELSGDEVITDNQTYRVYYTATTGTSDESVQMFDYQVKGNNNTSINNSSNYDKKSSSTTRFASGLIKDQYNDNKYDTKVKINESDIYINTWNTDSHNWNVNYVNGKVFGEENATTGIITGVNFSTGALNMGTNSSRQLMYEPGFFTKDPKPGKQVLSGYKLSLSRSGDTYKLTDVKKDNESVLRGYTTEGANFYPLDSIRKNNPDSANDNDHNDYFGMRYDIEFKIGDYLGDLNYTFKGDDDLWAVLDANENGGKVVIDLGGIHSALDKSVNLWKTILGKDNYTPEDKKNLSEDERNKTHTLTILYMERGAYASNCQMEFTLPNSKVINSEEAEKSLTFTKTTTSGTALAGATFTLYASDGTTVKDTAVSSPNGTVTFGGLYSGTYIIKETSAPNGYIASKDTWTVDVTTSEAKMYKTGDSTRTSVTAIANSTEKEEAEKNLTNGKTAEIIDESSRIFQINLNTATTGTVMGTGTYDYDENSNLIKPVSKEISAKGETYTVVKTLKNSNQTFVIKGETVEFNIDTVFPSYADDNTNRTFTITDTPTGMKVTGVKVSVGGTELTKNVDYTISELGVKDKAVTVSFTSDYIGTSNAHAAAAVRVEVTAVVTSDDGTYSNKATSGYDSTPSEVVGTSGSITINKTDDNKTTPNPLTGAKFSIKKGETTLEFVELSAGEYTLYTEDTVIPEGKQKVTDVTVNEKGVVTVKGLGAGEYVITETLAPEGYSVNNNIPNVTLEEGEHQNRTIQVKDSKLSALPSTGGIGTTIFTIAGCVIMIAAAGLFFASRKKSDNK